MADDTVSSGLRGLTRRNFLKGTAAAAATIGHWVHHSPTGPAHSLISEAAATEDWWLGPDFWANRLQDWAMRNGRMTCVAGSERRLRTASVLTRALNGRPVKLQVTTGTSIQGSGFSGFLIGAGANTDYRRAALVQAASGQGGGMLCVYGSDGRVRFLRHTSETAQFEYPVIPATTSGASPPRFAAEQVRLTLEAASPVGGNLTLTLKAAEAASGRLLSQAVLTGVAPADVAGGVALASSGSLNPAPAATYWFSQLQFSGVGFDWHPERSLGPIVGTLFSVTGSTLKMTAQLMPMRLQPDDVVRLEVRNPSTMTWVQRATAPVGPGYAAALRVTNWDAARGWDYRVVFSRGGARYGRVPKEPSSTQVRIASLCCTKATHRLLDRASDGSPKLPGEQTLGLYTARNVWFPFEQLADNIAAQSPDLLVALGDQYYEDAPTIKDQGPSPELDFLYKYLLWLWSFRDLTARIPCIVAVDDHDVFQGNLFGEGGVALPPSADVSEGGYANSAEWVNTVQRVQCGHNPDPVDPAPVAQGISVYFTRFRYGGVLFVLLEDRKFKTGGTGTDSQGNPIPPGSLQLLGARQEALLAALPSAGSGPPVVVLSQTLFGALATTADGRPSGSRSPNGWPPLARDRALRLIKSAGAVVLSGDTHLAALVRHGIDGPTDGPLQFTVPAGAATFQRWFQPAGALPNPTGEPYTGDFVDAFGNPMRVLAVRNMQWTQQTVVAAYGTPNYGHREFKEEGYGIVTVDLIARRHTFESWRWDVDPGAAGAAPMPGWPQSFPFSAA